MLEAISSPGWRKLDVSYFKYSPFSYATTSKPDELIGIDIELLEVLKPYLGVNISLTRAKSFNQLATNVSMPG